MQDTDDVSHITQIDSVLNELKNRLSVVSKQHDSVIRNSNHIIEEIEKISSTLLPHAYENKVTTSYDDIISGSSSSEETEELISHSTMDSMNVKNLVKNFDSTVDSMNVKKLVKNFERVTLNMSKQRPAKIQIEKSLNMRKILEKFERLNESIKQSEIAFRRAKEQLQNVGEAFNEQENIKDNDTDSLDETDNGVNEEGGTETGYYGDEEAE